jgi:hypothetical protein
MRYTEKNLRLTLEKVDPKTYDIYVNKAKLNLPDLINRMFIKGFFKTLKSSFPITAFLTESEISILTRAYDDLYGDGHGYFMFDEED